MHIKSSIKKLSRFNEFLLVSYGLVLILGVLILGKYTVYFLLGGAVLPILLYISVNNFSNIILFYIIFIPFIQHFSFYAIKAGEFYITPHMIIQFIILLVVFFKFLLTYKTQQNKLNFVDKLIIFLAVSSIFSLIYPYSLPVDHTKRWLLFYTGIFENITFYFVTLYLLRAEKKFTRRLIISITLSSLSALIIAFLELKGLGFNVISIFLSRMIIGFGFHNTNLFGLYSAIIFPLYFYLLINRKYYSIRIPILISFVVLSLLSILCFNRGTFLVMIIELLLLFRIKETRKIIYLFIFVLLIGAIYYHEIILLYIQRFLAGENEATTSAYIDYSALYRIEAWKLGVYLLFSFPFGLGGGGFLYAWDKFGPYSQINLVSPHQLLLSVGVDYGVLTMIIFIAILITSFCYCNIILKTKIASPSIFQFLKISIIGYVFYGITTGGELSHLSGYIAPNNGYTLILFILLAIISYHHKLILDKNEH